MSLHQNPDGLKNRKACYDIWFISTLELKHFSISECDFVHWSLNQKTHFCRAMGLKRKQLCTLHQKQDSPDFPIVYVEYWHISKVKLQNPDNDRFCFFWAVFWPFYNCRLGINWKIKKLVVCIRIPFVQFIEEMPIILTHPDSRTHVLPYLLVRSHLSTLQPKTVFFLKWFGWNVFYSDRCMRFFIVGTLETMPLRWVHLEDQTTIFRLFIVLFPSIKISFESWKHVQEYLIQKVGIINTPVL